MAKNSNALTERLTSALVISTNINNTTTKIECLQEQPKHLVKTSKELLSGKTSSDSDVKPPSIGSISIERTLQKLPKPTEIEQQSRQLLRFDHYRRLSDSKFQPKLSEFFDNNLNEIEEIQPTIILPKKQQHQTIPTTIAKIKNKLTDAENLKKTTTKLAKQDNFVIINSQKQQKHKRNNNLLNNNNRTLHI